jgi:hypothetical protein
MADTTFVGSHEKPENDYGQNGNALPSSLTPGQTKPNIKNVSPPAAFVPGLDPQDVLAHRTNGAPITTPDGMANRATGTVKVPDNGRPVTKPISVTVKRD